MANWLLKNLSSSFMGLGIFLLGFVIGTVLDVSFYEIYNKWDHDEKQKYKLAILALVQIFFIIFIIESTKNIKVLNYNFTLGLMSSQIFLFIHALESITNDVFDRQL